MIKSFRSLVGNKKKYLLKKTSLDKEAVFCIFKESVQEYFGRLGLEKILLDCFSEGTLFVRAQNPIWFSEFWSNREKIIQEMNKRAGTNLICEIKIK